MKKTFKRLGAVLLAAFMLLSTTICALADDNTQTGTPTAGQKITLNVSNIADGDTVYAYKLVSYNEPDFNSYTFNDSFKSYITTEKKRSDVQTYLAGLNAAGVNELLEGYATACKTGKTYQLPEASAKTTATSSNAASLQLDAGYYLLLTETTSKNSYIYTPLSAFVKMDGDDLVVYAGASNTALTQQQGAYTVSAKSATGPKIDKKTNATKGSEEATWKENAVAGVGDTVRFYVQVDIPKYTDGTTLNLTVNDTLTNLKYEEGTAKVYEDKPDAKGNNTSKKEITGAITNTDNIIAEQYKVDNSTGTQKLKFELDYAAIMNGKTDAKSVYVYYEAIVQPESVKTIVKQAPAKNESQHGGTNVASLTYSNASTPDSTHETDKVTTKVFNYYLKFSKKKGEKDEGLQGAKFSLYLDQAGTDVIKFVQETDTADGTVYYRPAAKGESGAVTEIEADFRIRGLDSNTYYIKETKTPAGYYAPSGLFEIKLISKLENDHYTGKLDAETSKMTALNEKDKNLILNSGVDPSTPHEIAAGLKNFSTPDLPTTGGTGTVLLSIGGVVLMAAGAYLLFFRKKKEN